MFGKGIPLRLHLLLLPLPDDGVYDLQCLPNSTDAGWDVYGALFLGSVFTRGMASGSAKTCK